MADKVDEIQKTSKVTPSSPSNAKISSPKKNAKTLSPPNSERPPGFHSNVIKLMSEDVQTVINKKLLPNEDIMDSFNVMLPLGFLPQWKVIFLCVITGGLALFYFAYRAFLRFLYRRKWITPKLVGFRSAIMVVTSFGRVMVWEVEATQRKDGNMVSYSRTNHIQNIVKGIIDCIKAVTNGYKLIGLVNTCAPPMSYDVTTLFAVYHLRDLRQLSLLSQASNPCGIWYCCPNFTCQVAMCFTGSTESDLSGEFSNLGAGICSVGNWTETINQLLNGSSEENDASSNQGFLTAKPSVIYLEIETSKADSVHSSSSTTVLNELADFANQILAHNKTIGPVFKGDPVDDGIMSDTTDNVIVSDAGKVKIPRDYFPLLVGEQILAVHGQIFRPKFYEWILTLLTIGIYYFFFISPKKRNRTAFIITTHRISEIIIDQRSGRVPTTFDDFTLAVRNFFPRRVLQHGFISRSKNRVSGGVVCDFGAIQMTFDMYGRRDSFDAFLKFYKFFRAGCDNYPLYDVQKPDNVVQLTNVERQVIELTKGEYLVGRCQGTNKWRPLLFPLGICCNAYVCPGVCYPWPAWLLCCTLRPKRQVSSIIVTNKAVYMMSAITNYTCNFFSVKDSFVLSYAPLADFTGVKTKVSSKGKEWCARRCWQNICCCDICKAAYPISKSTWEVTGSVANGTYINVGGGPKAFAPTDEFDSFDIVAARVQKAIWDATPLRSHDMSDGMPV